MSRVAGFRNAADEQRLRNEYLRTLQQEIDLSNMESNANAEYYRNQKLDIKPVVKVRSTADERQDQVLQTEIALKHLKSIMKADEATAILAKLRHDNEVLMLNTYWDGFKKNIEGISTIYPAIFNELWNRYKEKLESTNYTGIEIAGTMDTGRIEEKIADFKQMLIDNFDLTNQQNKTITSALYLLAEYSKRHSDNAEEIMQELQFLAEKKDISKILSTLSNLSTINKEAMEEIRKNFDSEVEARRHAVENERLKHKLAIAEEKKLVDNDYENLMQEDIDELYRKAEDILRDYNMDGYYRTHDNKRPNLTLKKLRDRIYDKPNLVDFIIYKTKGFNPKVQDAPAPNRKILSPAFKESREAWAVEHGRRKYTSKMAGSGLQVNLRSKNTKEKLHAHKEPNFGKYVLSSSLLKQGFLSLRYPSGAIIPSFPKTLISSTLQRILLDILYDKKFDEVDYHSLDEDDKKLFDRLCTFAKLDKKENLRFYRLKKYSDEQRDADVKRFNILRGELIAGNDNPDIVKELKKLLYKLMDERVINKRDYGSLMHRLLLVD